MKEVEREGGKAKKERGEGMAGSEAALIILTQDGWCNDRATWSCVRTGGRSDPAEG